MNHKILTVCACLFLAGILTACGQKLENIYDAEAFDAEKILADELKTIRADGFASELCVPEISGENNAEGIEAEAFALFDLDGQEILSQKNIHEKVYPASTTKILTCLIALEIGNLEETVTVPSESEITVSGSSMADLKPGDEMTLKEMLYAMMVPSGNDAAVAVAMHLSGSVDEFAKLMNKRAAELGATHSNFVNPHGLPDEEHYTTVYDMYLIFNEAVKNPVFREISSTKEYTTSILNKKDGSRRDVTWTSGNGFYNEKYSMPEGYSYFAGKTGHTNAAGFCLALGEEKSNGNEYISIIMKAPVYENLYGGMQTLIKKADQ